jgi:hypoxanthine-guanine phosphoribosyltransferase
MLAVKLPEARVSVSEEAVNATLVIALAAIAYEFGSKFPESHTVLQVSVVFIATLEKLLKYIFPFELNPN